MVYSEIGSITSKYWLEIPDHFPHVKLDEFVVMPNHIHGIIILDYSLVGSRHGVALLQFMGDVGTCHGMTLPDQITSATINVLPPIKIISDFEAFFRALRRAVFTSGQLLPLRPYFAASDISFSSLSALGIDAFVK
jgi:hypothetical protein